MNVALWAEIRRLVEIEKLSARAIAKRLHCSRHTVAAAIASPQPPASKTACRTSLLEPRLPQINDLLAKYPELSAVRIHEEIARGSAGYAGSTDGTAVNIFHLFARSALCFFLRACSRSFQADEWPPATL